MPLMIRIDRHFGTGSSENHTEPNIKRILASFNLSIEIRLALINIQT